MSATLDNKAIFAGKHALFSPLASEIYQVPPFIDFVALDPDRVLLVEEQTGDLVEVNFKSRSLGQRIKGRGRCKSRSNSPSE